MSDWHVTLGTAQAYAAGSLPDPDGWSLETHVLSCVRCARAVSDAASDPALIRIRRNVMREAELSAQRAVRPVVAVRGRSGVRLTVTPALRPMWLLGALGAVLATLALEAIDATRLPLVLLVAPLLPLAGIAVGSSPRLDRGAELVVSTPMPLLRLLLLRSAAVLTVCLPLLLLLSVLTSSGVVGWLLPAGALVAVALALSTWLRVEVATGCAAAVWAVLALGPAVLSPGLPVVLTPGAAPVWAAAAVCGAFLLFARRHELDEPGKMS